MDPSGSKSDDFRSVIDDLTVENKRLRRKLRKFERLHCSNLQEDKLFEVRHHGLSAEKKKELEETLRIFASNLEQPPGKPEPTSPSGFSSRDPVLQPSLLDSLSSTSYSRPADSAYASILPSSDTNAGKLHDEPQHVRTRNPKKRDLDNLVYTVSEGSIGADQLRRSEKVKKKLVVRKLEQLFTGKESASQTCSQLRQQKESFQSTRRTDRSTNEGSGLGVLSEGVREARILSAEAESLDDRTSSGRMPATVQRTNDIGCSGARSRTGDTNASSDSSPEQRPTRPIDIDPNRAQIPAENMEYIRHLGFSSSSVDVNATGEDGEGWIYLNLLMSMAQLHTINVTPNLVRKAVAEVSDRLELSRDGRKIRWKGGTEGTRTSTDVGSSGDQSSEKSPDDLAGRSGKRRRPGNEFLHREPVRSEHEAVLSLARISQHPIERSTDDEHAIKTRRIFLGQAYTHDRLSHKPLSGYTIRSEEDECYSQTSNSMTSVGTAGDTISAASTTNASMSQKRAPDPLETKNGHGPIIFYQGARFCTDLSGDMGCLSEESTEFGQRCQDPLGATKITSDPSFFDDDIRSASRESQTSPDHLDHGDDRSGSRTPDLQFPTVYSTGGDAACERGIPLEFEASGIGGVQPYDNFTIDVGVRQITSALGQRDPKAPTSPEGHQQLLYNTTCRAAARTKLAKVVVRGEIVSTLTTNLPPSSLPPPSYYLSLSTSETDDDNETESDSNDSSANDSRSSQMEVEPSAPSSLMQVYRIAGSGRPPEISNLESEKPNLDADDDAW